MNGSKNEKMNLQILLIAFFTLIGLYTAKFIFNIIYLNKALNLKKENGEKSLWDYLIIYYSAFAPFFIRDRIAEISHHNQMKTLRIINQSLIAGIYAIAIYLGIKIFVLLGG